MPSTKQLKIIIIILIVIVAGEGVCIYSLYVKGKTKPSVIQPESSTTITPRDFKAGTIGEMTIKNEKTGKEESLITPNMPLVISGTTGTIKEIQIDRLIVEGSGTNFADSVSRTLTLIFTDETLTFTKNQATRYAGEEGLKYFKVGTRVLFDSSENIRGKTEFTVKSIGTL